MIAAEEDRQEIVKALIDRGADLNATDHDGQTALMRACLNTSIVLLNAGANPNLKDSEGETALSLARKNEDDDLIKLLVARGARE
jgi:ankyrin repeat protein